MKIRGESVVFFSSGPDVTSCTDWRRRAQLTLPLCCGFEYNKRKKKKKRSSNRLSSGVAVTSLTTGGWSSSCITRFFCTLLIRIAECPRFYCEPAAPKQKSKIQPNWYLQPADRWCGAHHSADASTLSSSTILRRSSSSPSLLPPMAEGLCVCA